MLAVDSAVKVYSMSQAGHRKIEESGWRLSQLKIPYQKNRGHSDRLSLENLILDGGLSMPAGSETIQWALV